MKNSILITETWLSALKSECGFYARACTHGGAVRDTALFLKNCTEAFKTEFLPSKNSACMRG
jgi:hypothetical protein